MGSDKFWKKLADKEAREGVKWLRFIVALTAREKVIIVWMFSDLKWGKILKSGWRCTARRWCVWGKCVRERKNTAFG